MAIRENREYRSIPMEIRMEQREDGESSFLVEGYASTFEPYVMFEDEGIQYKEQIDPKAFEECDMSDVIFVRDHAGTVFARTKNGTLELSIDEHGLFTRTDLSKEIQAGMYSQMSFAFTVREDSYDRETHTRTISKINKLFDVSAVSFPANPGTDISATTRSFFDGVIEMERAERLAHEQELKEAKANFYSIGGKNDGT